jgi:hypothetical protein
LRESIEGRIGAAWWEALAACGAGEAASGARAGPPGAGSRSLSRTLASAGPTKFEVFRNL